MLYLLSRVYFYLFKIHNNLKTKLFNIYIRHQLKSCGENLFIHPSALMLNLERMSFGDNFKAGKGFCIRAHTKFNETEYNSSINIGNNFYAGTDCFISAIGNLVIGDNVTLASRVTIIDNYHGKSDYSDISTPVMKRELSIKGDIIIEDNVWLCESVIVLSNVRIGKNSIIGANAVVTKDIPANSIALGCPAKIYKIIH